MKYEIPEQWKYAKRFIEHFMKLIKDGTYKGYKLHVTGHSLGGCLGELSAWQFKLPAVVFDSPGARKIIQSQLCEEIEPRSVKVLNYVSLPNLVNTGGQHSGVVVELRLPDIQNTAVNLKGIPATVGGILKQTVNLFGLWDKTANIFANLIDVAGIKRENTEQFINQSVQNLGRHGIQRFIQGFDGKTGLPLRTRHVISWPEGANQMVLFELLYKEISDQISANVKPDVRQDKDEDEHFTKFLVGTQKFKLKQIGYETELHSTLKLPYWYFPDNWAHFVQQMKALDNNLAAKKAVGYIQSIKPGNLFFDLPSSKDFTPFAILAIIEDQMQMSVLANLSSSVPLPNTAPIKARL